MDAGEVYGARQKALHATRPAIIGRAFSCPVCGGRFRRFLPFGLNGRRNARCPGCGSLERHRFMWMHLRDRHRLMQRRLRLLHIAPEHCIRDALAANPGLNYVTVDMFDPDADHAADLTALPFRDESFDFVICSHVLEHIEDDRAAMAELFRVLVPGGRAVVMVPIEMDRPQTYEDSSIDSAAGRNEAFGHPYHVRVCGADYPDRLRQAGFTVNLVYSRSMTPHMRRFWRINKTVLFDCTKP
ncbi:MAG: methyltransferase domain-containing protein [Proteobacteria bacterium]|nr:methyltransferase domain-containing protein [Pseudomonadota bacterium]